MPDEFGPSLPPVDGGELSEQLRGKFRPSMIAVTEETAKADSPGIITPDFSELEKAFRTIETHLDKGHPFSNRETDVGARLIMLKLQPEERLWIKEIAERIHKRPLWHCFAGWFRYAHENSMANAPVFDGSWDTQTAIDPNMSVCIVCSTPFPPKVYGQKVCTNKCGAVLDKRQIEERLAKQQPPQVAV